LPNTTSDFDGAFQSFVLLQKSDEHYNTTIEDRPIAGPLNVQHKGKDKAVHTMNAYGEAEVQLHTFLTSASHGGGWSDSHPGRFIPRLKSLPT
jgi:hypothetical protein